YLNLGFLYPLWALILFSFIIRATPVNLQYSTPAGNLELGSVALDERLLYLDSFAKYAAAFFKMSRSSSTRDSSVLSVAFSA
ncbi:MAG: hypothetical protein K9M49_08805, partial [Candidatus Marinimicrobia bacterium]|nr:hypothetical protein [Candidatus Neomarinimicrobiota bacterium]